MKTTHSIITRSPLATMFALVAIVFAALAIVPTNLQSGQHRRAEKSERATAPAAVAAVTEADPAPQDSG
ncbi:MAG: hypothetical protein QOG48_2324, partial [Verrucomicrobiota bacterium]